MPLGSNAAGAGALDAYAAVNQVVSGELNANQTEAGVRDLFAGIGQTGDEYVDVQLDPISDSVGDAGSAPDFDEAYVYTDQFNADFEYSLADDTSPNATFVTYIDADQNDTTGDLEASGAEFRITLTRTLTSGTYSGTAQSHVYNATRGQYEPVDIGADAHTYAFDDHPEYVEFDINTQGRSCVAHC